MELLHMISSMVSLQDSIALFVLWIASALIVRAISTKICTKKTPAFPPSPRAYPVIGHLHLLAPITHQAFHKLSQKFGPIIQIYIGSIPAIVVSSPEIAKEVLKTNGTIFADRPRSSTAAYLTYGGSDFATAPYGPYWKFMKKIYMTELLGIKTLDRFLPIRQEEIRQMIKLLLMKGRGNEAVDVGEELIRVTNNNITRMMLSQRCSGNEDEAREVREMVIEMMQQSAKLKLSDFIWFCKKLKLQGFSKRLKEARDKFDFLMERIIKEHESARMHKKKMGDEGNSSESTKNVLELLLDISEDEKSEVKLSRNNIKAFILNIFGAGTDSSALTVEWALSELINHPKIMQKVQQEMDSTIGKQRIVQESDIPKLPYLEAIVKETLRLHPTGPLAVRQSTEKCTVSGYEIPAKTRLFVNLWSIGRDPNHWENPLEFRPERFLNQDGSRNAQMDAKGQHFHFMPFGNGIRGCPGASLALRIVPATLASLVQCFDWKIIGDGCVVDMEEGPGLTLRKANPLLCIPVARLNPFPDI